MTALPVIGLSGTADAAHAAIETSPAGAIEIARPPLADLSYCAFVEAVLRRPGFRLDFRGQTPEAALGKAADQLFGAGAFAAERAAFAADIAILARFLAGMVDGGHVDIAIRTYFAPGDLVWHIDRVGAARALRLLWPIGRPAGMRLVPREAIDPAIFAGYMRREFPLLCRLDAAVLDRGGDVETLWAHRPMQLAAMRSGDFPFLRDRSQEVAVTPGAASIHRVATHDRAGSYHRTDWANRLTPGLQLVMTASGGAA